MGCLVCEASISCAVLLIIFFCCYLSHLFLNVLLIYLSLLQVRTVKVSNVSHGANEHDIREFFSFSGEIENVELQRLVHFFGL